MTGKPLTEAEVAELDTYGEISGRMPLPRRALDLWEREILYGREVMGPNDFVGLITRDGCVKGREITR